MREGAMAAELRVGGAEYSEWTEIEVSRSIEHACGSFVLTGPRLPPNIAGAACEVILDGETVITGYVDGCSGEEASDARGVTLGGRDKAADLLDCSPKIPEMKGLSILKIAEKVVKPFGIRVVAPFVKSVYGKPFDLVAGQPGETVFEFLDRLARSRNLLLWSDGLGGLVIGRPTARGLGVELRRGKNLKRLAVEADWTLRYSEIRVVAQQTGDDATYGDEAAAIAATEKDPEVARYRPLTIVCEQAADLATVRERARYEVRGRKAQGHRYTATVEGWRVGQGLPFWPLGRRVPVFHEPFGLAGERLTIAGARHFRNERDGTITELDLVPPGALDRPLEPEERADDE